MKDAKDTQLAMGLVNDIDQKILAKVLQAMMTDDSKMFELLGALFLKRAQVLEEAEQLLQTFQ